MRETRNEARRRRHKRVRQRIAGTSSIPRLCVFRSLKHIYAQIIDDDAGQTLVSASTLDADVRAELEGQSKVDQAKVVGRRLAEKALKTEIEASGPQPVPLHIRNAPTALMKKLGYSRGYLYPHNHPGGWVKQEYLPGNMRNQVFYRPTGRGFEKEIRRRLAEKTRKR